MQKRRHGEGQDTDESGSGPQQERSRRGHGQIHRHHGAERRDDAQVQGGPEQQSQRHGHGAHHQQQNGEGLQNGPGRRSQSLEDRHVVIVAQGVTVGGQGHCHAGQQHAQ